MLRPVACRGLERVYRSRSLESEEAWSYRHNSTRLCLFAFLTCLIAREREGNDITDMGEKVYFSPPLCELLGRNVINHAPILFLCFWQFHIFLYYYRNISPSPLPSHLSLSPSLSPIPLSLSISPLPVSLTPSCPVGWHCSIYVCEILIAWSCRFSAIITIKIIVQTLRSRYKLDSIIESNYW